MSKHIISLLAIIAIPAFTVSCAQPEEIEAAETTAPAFRPALEAHLATIASRDLEGFEKTLTGDGDLNVIFPNGVLLPTNKDVMDFHEQWFADTDWVMEPEIVKVIEGGDMATALLKYRYRDTADGEARSNWLVLVFQVEDGEWKLVHDQNTRIENPEA